MDLNKYHLDSRWRFEDLCNNYNINRATMFNYLKMSLADANRVGLSIEEIALMQPGPKLFNQLNFQTIFALNMTFPQLCDAFHPTLEQFRSLKFTDLQKRMLSQTLGWTPSVIRRHFDIDLSVASRIWFGFVV
jgi:hypothetical protein